MATMTTTSEPVQASAASMSRPIERLPARRQSNEPKEAMNCKSCRKRKIKCNRLKPSCEACQVFNCACIYDAIPKKRGPKTDVLEALLKRVNGLEKQLKDDAKPSPRISTSSADGSTRSAENAAVMERNEPRAQPKTAPEQSVVAHEPTAHQVSPDSHVNASADALLDTYFSRLHAKPYYILDELATRERLRDGALPHFITNAIYAVSIRHLPHYGGGYYKAIHMSEEFARQSRAQIDVDEPNIDHLQALLLLSVAYHQNGRGKRSYMMLSHAVGMAFALNLHRELPTHLRIVPLEREGRRNLFWTVYFMDRFTASGSMRPSLISDESVHLRFPASRFPGSANVVEGHLFPGGADPGFAAGPQSSRPDNGRMLVEIVRVLGITNRYLAAGGVKGDSHFPWHGQSTLSRIRSDLEQWAANTQETFHSLDLLYRMPDNCTLVLSKLIYHLIHCLIYRPFLPIDLAELSGTGHNQSWQVDATSSCFFHANAIAEMVEVGNANSVVDWPSFTSFCICTAGSVHVHGAHYISFQEGNIYHRSAEFLSREMLQLVDLKAVSISAEHQRNTLQQLYMSHANLVKSLATNPLRFSPVFQMEDFFDRYSGIHIDASYAPFADFPVGTAANIGSQDIHGYGPSMGVNPHPLAVDPSYDSTQPHPMASGPHDSGVAEGAADPNDQFASAQPMQDLQEIPLRHKDPVAATAESSSGGHNDFVQDRHDPTLTQVTNSPVFQPTPLLMTPVNEFREVSQHRFMAHTGQPSPGTSAASVSVDVEQDPFLSLLEQLGESDSMVTDGPPTEFDFHVSEEAWFEHKS